MRIQGEASRRMEIPEERIRLVNIPEGYRAEFSEEEGGIDINVVGLSEDLSALQADNITGTIDLKGWFSSQGIEVIEPGTYVVEVAFNLPEEVAIPNPARATLYLEELGEE